MFTKSGGATNLCRSLLAINSFLTIDTRADCVVIWRWPSRSDALGFEGHRTSSKEREKDRVLVLDDNNSKAGPRHN